MEQLTQITPNIWQLVLPMAPPLDSVNVHIVADGDGQWAVIDTGPYSAEAEQLFEQAFATLGGTVSQVIVTHFHPDHLGMAGWLCQKYNAPLTMTQTEWLTARWLSRDNSPAYLETLADYYTNHGVPQPVLGEIVRPQHVLF
jgi:glyoxylase-like metal-dependent hydrolase (beta-lactamase superfamily II)